MNDNRIFMKNKSVLLDLLSIGMPNTVIATYFNVSISTTLHWKNKLKETNDWNGKTPSFIEAIPTMLKLLADLLFRRELLPSMKIYDKPDALKNVLENIFEVKKIIEILDLVIPHIYGMQLFSFSPDVPEGYRNLLNKFDLYRDRVEAGSLELWRKYLKKIADGQEINIIVNQQKDLRKIITNIILQELTTSVKGNISSVFTIAICKNIDEIVLPTLDPRIESVLKMHYGLGEGAQSIDEISTKLDLSRERVRQIIEKGLRILRHNSRRSLIFEPIPSESMMMYMLEKIKTPTVVQESNKHKILDLDFSVRAINLLKSSGIVFLEDIKNYSKNDLVKFCSLGRKSMSEIEEMMKKYNLSFRE